MTIIEDRISWVGCRERIITIDVEHLGFATGIAVGWPPPFVVGGIDPAAAGIAVAKLGGGGVFVVQNILLSFRTVVLPRGFEMASATLKLRLTNAIDPEGLSIACDRFFWGETVEAADYTSAAQPGLDGLVPIADAIPLVGQDLDFSVRPSSVLRRKNDPSQFRLTVTGGEPAPLADSGITFFNGGFDDRTIVPRLECHLRGCLSLSAMAAEE